MRHLFDTPLCASPFNRGAPKNVAPLMAAALPAMFTAGSNLIGGAVNNIVNRSNMQYQADIAKDLAQYQWDNFNSYPAQVKSMLKAGLNPSAILGQGGSGTVSGPSVNMPTAHPVDLGLGTSLSDIANYTLSLAQAKKAGVDTKNVEIDTKAKEFELELSKWFSVPAKIAEITSVWKNVMLQDDEHNIKEWQKVKEKTLAGLTGIQKQAAEKELANMDTVIEQQNRQREEDIKLTKEKQKTEGTQQSANRAAAKASVASANLAGEQAKTEADLREVRKFAIDLGNHLQGLEYGFNLETYQQRLEKFAHEVGIVKWTEFLNSVEAKDRDAYNAVQRIIMGKGTKEDGKTLWNLVNDGRQLIPFKP